MAAASAAPGAKFVDEFDELIAGDLDGVVIATPSTLHARQALAALARGRAVFCQKPLARTTLETRQIIDAAREADVLLGIDFCYRDIAGASEMRRLLQSGELGEIFAVDLTFHNAYGPDKAWFYDPRLSGGGCVIDLGIHLGDFAGWISGNREFQDVRSTLWRQGVRPKPDAAEAFSLAPRRSALLRFQRHSVERSDRMVSRSGRARRAQRRRAGHLTLSAPRPRRYRWIPDRCTRGSY